jgi:pantoate--beta-alanine ligase
LKIVRTVDELMATLGAWRGAPGAIGLAPTMGNLHDGHLGLVDALRREGARRVVASIFVNPAQFGPGEDFASYPRTFGADRDRLAARGVDLVFAPGIEEMYPPGEPLAARIDIPELSSDLCGAVRPGHFVGVLTVVAKLLNLVQPDLAAFGEKDYQQLVMIRAMVRSLCFPARIIAVATVRDADGLALSSRNQYLSRAERAAAPQLHRSLAEAAGSLRAGGDVAVVERAGALRLQAAGFEVDYFAVRNAGDLAPPTPGAGPLVVLAAGQLGRARLIDNLTVQFDTAAS